MIVGQVVLAGALDAAHQQEAPLRMPKLCVMVQIVAANPALSRQRGLLLQAPGHAQ